MPEHRANSLDWRRFSRRWLPPLIWGYYTVLFIWLLAYWLSGDRFGYLALFNQVAHFLFFPLVVVLPLAVWLRGQVVWGGWVVAVAVFLWYWGALFLPNLSAPPVTVPRLRVFTYNSLGYVPDGAAAVDVIRQVDADVVCLQEVNYALATILGEQLRAEYPYQIFDPVDGVAGAGIISKYPFTVSAEPLPLEWVGVPQIIELNWDGQPVMVVNFHMFATGLSRSDIVEKIFRYREWQAAALADYARDTDLPLLVIGDANVTSLSTAYQVVTTELTDSWQTAGWGFGHTFPGSDIVGSSRPRFGSWLVPQWLVRIDYVFHNQYWQAVSAQLAPFDGLSDHRGVVVDLALVAQP